MPQASKKRYNKNKIIPNVIAIVVIVGLLVGAFFLVKSLFFKSPAKGNSSTGSTTPVDVTTTAAPTTTTTVPGIPDDGTDGYASQGLYIWNNKAFELFFGGDDAAKTYAQAISSYKQKLGPNINVYNMVVPNHSEFGLPERLRQSLGCSSQRQHLSTIYSSYTADVKAVDVYDTLNVHKNEYLYFNTDTHWAAGGAYYAYQKFCEVANLTPMAQTKMKKSTVSNFLGYLSYVTEDPTLAANPDYIELYDIPVNYTAQLSTDGFTFTQVDSINSPYEDAGYSMFCWGDNACFKITNHDSQTGRKIALVKDSYGNCFAPYLVANYDEVHVIDFRDFPQNLATYCAENGITDVLFFNNVMSANSQVDVMNGLFG